jgi:hypothetical protein
MEIKIHKNTKIKCIWKQGNKENSWPWATTGFKTQWSKYSLEATHALRATQTHHYEDSCLLGCRAVITNSPARLTHRPDDGSSTDLWNVGKLIPVYTALQPRWQLFSYSVLWERHAKLISVRPDFPSLAEVACSESTERNCTPQELQRTAPSERNCRVFARGRNVDALRHGSAQLAITSLSLRNTLLLPSHMVSCFLVFRLKCLRMSHLFHACYKAISSSSMWLLKQYETI